jgi:hypothetical protein
MGNLTYQKTARLSFAIGGGGFLVRRRSSALFGVSGGMAQADVAYRLSRRSTVSLSYAFVHFGFTQAFGGSDVHTAGVSYAVSLSRHWELGVMTTANRVEHQTVRQVFVDPVIAAITGITSGQEAFHATTTLGGYGARLSRGLRRGNLTFGYMQGVSPGNGLYLTSRQRVADVQLQYTALRRWNFGAGASYGTLGTISEHSSSYRSTEMRAGLSRSLGRGDLHFTANVAGRRYHTDFTNFRSRLQTHATIGIAYSPGDVPLALW